RKLSFVFVARSGEDRHVFEYDPTRCRFTTLGAVAVGEPRASYLAGFECWASDLLATLDGSIGPIALMFGRARLWNALPRRFHFDIFPELYRANHPLRRPADYARTYERIWRSVADTVPAFAAATS